MAADHLRHDSTFYRKHVKITELYCKPNIESVQFNRHYCLYMLHMYSYMYLLVFYGRESLTECTVFESRFRYCITEQDVSSIKGLSEHVRQELATVNFSNPSLPPKLWLNTHKKHARSWKPISPTHTRHIYKQPGCGETPSNSPPCCTHVHS